MVEFPDSIRSHKLHPSHELRRLCYPTNEYTCNGCNLPGNGFRYRCTDNCNFNLHEYCARCPPRLQPRFFMHPKHTLKLHTPQNGNSWYSCLLPTSFNKQPTEENMLRCHLCEEDMDRGSHVFYTCRECGFHVHPLCSQLPEFANHGKHRATDRERHELKLRDTGEDRKCGVCKTTCSGWRYSCDRESCKVDIHIKCITSDYHGPRWNVYEVLKRFGVAVISIVLPAVTGQVVGNI